MRRTCRFAAPPQLSEEATLDPTVRREQRQSRRYPFHCPVVFAGKVIGGTGRLLNLSMTGCGVHTGQRIENRAELRLFIFLPDYEPPLMMPASVRWAQDTECGLEFIEMTQDQLKRLQEFLTVLHRRIGH